MSDQPTLRILAREAMQAGTLPDRRPDRIWGGPGSAVECAVCGKTIDGNESELELQYAERAGSVRTYHVHVRCFAAWEIERPDAGATDRSLPREGNIGIIRASEHYTKSGGE